MLFRSIRKHPEIGYRILKDIPRLRDILPGVLYHHERFDGQGYPEGLKGEEIPLGSRIVAVIIAWEAMNSDRPYRKALPKNVAVDQLNKGADTQFDPKVTEPFLRLLEREGESFIKKDQKFDIYSFIQD